VPVSRRLSKSNKSPNEDAFVWGASNRALPNAKCQARLAFGLGAQATSSNLRRPQKLPPPVTHHNSVLTTSVVLSTKHTHSIHSQTWVSLISSLTLVSPS